MIFENWLVSQSFNRRFLILYVIISYIHTQRLQGELNPSTLLDRQLYFRYTMKPLCWQRDSNSYFIVSKTIASTKLDHASLVPAMGFEPIPLLLLRQLPLPFGPRWQERISRLELETVTWKDTVLPITPYSLILYHTFSSMSRGNILLQTNRFQRVLELVMNTPKQPINLKILMDTQEF